MIDINRKLRRKQDIIEADVDDDKVMMDAVSGQYFGLDPVASRIWELMTDDTTIIEITNKLMLEYKVEKQVCMKETSAFIASLLENNLAKYSD